MTRYLQLCINPGSTSTKISVFANNELLLDESLSHSTADLAKYGRVGEQYTFRRQAITDFLATRGFDIKGLHAVVGRGGLLKPIPSGTYRVTDAMVRDLQEAKRGEHASNLGGLLARDLADALGIPAFIVDPVVVDELEPVARISGHPAIERRSIFHALNQKAVAKRYALAQGKDYRGINVIVAHLGGGISVGAHRQGRVVDVNNALDGEGPFSPERSGGLPSGDLAKLCFSGKYSHDEIKRMITGQGGLVAYLGTNDGREAIRRMEAGDEHAGLVYKALAYQVSKEIGAMAAVLGGKVDAIILTGGLAFDQSHLVPWITEAVSFIAGVVVMPGEGEMTALCAGGLRILRGEELAKEYE